MNVLVRIFEKTHLFKDAVSVSDIKAMIQEKHFIPIQEQVLCGLSGKPLPNDHIMTGEFETLTLNYRLLGGKGGFGSMLKAKGARMSSKKATNFESCRDLSGRRLQTVHDAEKLAEYLDNESERKRKQAEEKEKKIKQGLAASIVKKRKFDDQDFVKEHEKTVESIKEACIKLPTKSTKKKIVSAW
jgi:hypothetical protein